MKTIMSDESALQFATRYPLMKEDYDTFVGFARTGRKVDAVLLFKKFYPNLDLAVYVRFYDAVCVVERLVGQSLNGHQKKMIRICATEMTSEEIAAAMKLTVPQVRYTILHPNDLD